MDISRLGEDITPPNQENMIQKQQKMSLNFGKFIAKNKMTDVLKLSQIAGLENPLTLSSLCRILWTSCKRKRCYV